ncbi:hypothetical protein GCK72_010494 [Caenorhabditis remanei]|uniref:Uncharacterized protein n=1 Tax=Caenorhabditis remanei TaxID=31234 RepID=A0A6A5H781_CAERE|nr:hypothetical protein GCK72_010494 [Caenorhabditis remanei]KAF1762232.1 hypothetical protein GCK72_010494 [Caenorhabditis remanei]
MGLVISLVAPTVHMNDNISSRILLGPDKPENNPSSPENISKYDNISCPVSTELGPSPGNKPPLNPVVGVPTILPPSDTTSKAQSNSVYDTLKMTPEVDWNKKKTQ